MKESANIAQFDELNPILIFYEKNSLPPLTADRRHTLQLTTVHL